MEKRYQVFVSSTYTDLKEERSKVIQTLMEMDCIPAGMELFPAMDEEQFEFIKKVIDDCDYYIIILGGRYGSITEGNISYTEKEYNYAKGRGLRIIALIHENPSKLPADKFELDSAIRDKFVAFREKLRTGRLVKEWSVPADLPSLVSLSLQKTIKTYPAVGWVRGNIQTNEEILREINDLRKENERLKAKPVAIADVVDVNNIASMYSVLSVALNLNGSSSASGKDEIVKITWGELWGLIAPDLAGYPSEYFVRSRLVNSLVEYFHVQGKERRLTNHQFHVITIQYIAYGFIAVGSRQDETGSLEAYWSITPKGESAMINELVVRDIPNDLT